MMWKYVQKTLLTTWCLKVRLFGTLLKRYLTALEKAKGLTDGKLFEQASTVRAITDMKSKLEGLYIKFIEEIESLNADIVLKGLIDSESSTSRNTSVAM